MRIKYWSSDVCSSDRLSARPEVTSAAHRNANRAAMPLHPAECLKPIQDAFESGLYEQQNHRSEERRVGKSVSVRVDLGGGRIIKKKKQLLEDSHNRTIKYLNRITYRTYC